MQNLSSTLSRVSRLFLSWAFPQYKHTLGLGFTGVAHSVCVCVLLLLQHTGQ